MPHFKKIELLYSPVHWQMEVELLQQFSGDHQDNSCLKSIGYTSGKHFTNCMNSLVMCVCVCVYKDLTFTNGCRAPPWRQVLGDICYLLVQPWDTEHLCITASTEGYFVNKVVQLTYPGCILHHSYAIFFPRVWREEKFITSVLEKCISLSTTCSRPRVLTSLAALASRSLSTRRRMGAVGQRTMNCSLQHRRWLWRQSSLCNQSLLISHEQIPPLRPAHSEYMPFIPTLIMLV